MRNYLQLVRSATTYTTHESPSGAATMTGSYNRLERNIARRAITSDERGVPSRLSIRKQTFEAPRHASADCLSLPIPMLGEVVLRLPLSRGRFEYLGIGKELAALRQFPAVLEGNTARVLFLRQGRTPPWGVLGAIAARRRERVSAASSLGVFMPVLRSDDVRR